jgi:hypothetical protein
VTISKHAKTGLMVGGGVLLIYVLYRRHEATLANAAQYQGSAGVGAPLPTQATLGASGAAPQLDLSGLQALIGSLQTTAQNAVTNSTGSTGSSSAGGTGIIPVGSVPQSDGSYIAPPAATSAAGNNGQQSGGVFGPIFGSMNPSPVTELVAPGEMGIMQQALDYSLGQGPALPAGYTGPTFVNPQGQTEAASGAVPVGGSLPPEQLQLTSAGWTTESY